jgi:hypothetical protein
MLDSISFASNGIISVKRGKETLKKNLGRFKINKLIKSQKSGDTVKSSRCTARKCLAEHSRQFFILFLRASS